MDCEALMARTGRHRQLYDKHFRLVAGCIPYKIKKAKGHGDNFVDRIRVLMISTPNQNTLIFPKGGWENDEKEEDAACREALEEAGVKGILQRKLGVWEFRSKSRQNSCSIEGWCRGSMFTLQVTELLPSWPEMATHGRKWLTVSEALECCRYEWMREALCKLKTSFPIEVGFPIAMKSETPLCRWPNNSTDIADRHGGDNPQPMISFSYNF